MCTKLVDNSVEKSRKGAPTLERSRIFIPAHKKFAPKNSFVINSLTIGLVKVRCRSAASGPARKFVHKSIAKMDFFSPSGQPRPASLCRRLARKPA